MTFIWLNGFLPENLMFFPHAAATMGSKLTYFSPWVLSSDYEKNEPSWNSLVMFTHLTLNKCLLEDLLSAEHPIFSFSKITAFSLSQVPPSLGSLFCPGFPGLPTFPWSQLWVLPPLPSLLYRPPLTTHTRTKIIQLRFFFKMKFHKHLTMPGAHVQCTHVSVGRLSRLLGAVI